MRKKTIAIDINEVIRDFRAKFFDIYYSVFPALDENYPYGEFYDMDKSFPFYDETKRIDKNLRDKFQYEDYVFEIYARAKLTNKMIIPMMESWIYNQLYDYEPELNPDILIVSPLEGGLSIPATLSFLSRIALKERNIYFPVDSSTIWDKCDILITANPKLIESCPEGKNVIKINALYNKDTNTKYTFDSFADVIQDPNNTVKCLLEDLEVEITNKELCE